MFEPQEGMHENVEGTIGGACFDCMNGTLDVDFATVLPPLTPQCEGWTAEESR
jgi:hypothetical protein